MTDRTLEQLAQALMDDVEEFGLPPKFERTAAILDGLVLRRKPLTIDNLYIDFDAKCVMLDGEEIVMSRKEFQVLAFLASNVGIAYTREDLLRAVWGTTYAQKSTVTEHVRRVRLKIGEGWIVTKEHGYMFVNGEEHR